MPDQFPIVKTDPVMRNEVHYVAIDVFSLLVVEGQRFISSAKFEDSDKVIFVVQGDGGKVVEEVSQLRVLIFPQLCDLTYRELLLFEGELEYFEVEKEELGGDWKKVEQMVESCEVV